MAVTPLLYLLTGEWAFERTFSALMRRPTGTDEAASPSPQMILIYLLGGLLITLSLILALACLGLPLWLAALLPLVPPLFRFRRAAVLLNPVRPVLSFNYLLWCTVIAILGTSIIGTVDGYQTAWRNNYADFAWHMGMISSFVFGENFPPQNHIFPPLTLSYPFFINLWTASLWVFDAVPAALGWIFIYQWLFIWTAVYAALDGSRWRTLPWVVLLGGGGYEFVFRTFNLGDNSQLEKFGPFAYDLLDHGYPWVPFLDTIWVPQRPALFGAPLLLSSIALGHSALVGDASNDRERRTFFSGLLLGLSPLVHTHFFLIAACYLGLLHTFRAIPRADRRANLKLLVLFCLGLSPALLYAPWLLGKAGIVQIAGGWMQTEVFKQSGLLSAMAAGAKLWWSNGLLWFALTGLAIGLSKRYAAGAALAVLFMFGNLIQIAAWNWDEIKIFLALFLISITLWQTVAGPRAKYAQWLLLLLVVPCLVELGVLLKRYENLTVYNQAELRDSKLIQESTPPQAIIAAKPDHNSPVTLTGRKLYYGYEGTLSSHGIPYEGRSGIQNDFGKLKNCRRLPDKPVCPDYIFWSWREKNFWKRPEPGEGAEATKYDFLYKIR